MAIQLKVKRTVLLEKLREARQQAVSGYDVKLKAYEKEVAAKTKLAAKVLRQQIAKGNISVSRYGAEVKISTVKLKLDKPNKLSVSKLAVLDAQIRNLELATNDLLTISDKSDYFRYL